MFRKLLYNFDSFAASPTFRVNGQSTIMSACCGVFSLILMSLFVYLFVIDMVKIYSFQKITAKENIKISQTGTPQISNLQFAIGIDGFSLANATQSLQIQSFHIKKNENGGGSERKIALEVCSQQQWNSVQNIDSYFELYGMDQMLCPAKSQNISIANLTSDNISESIQITIKVPCVQVVTSNYTNTTNGSNSSNVSESTVCINRLSDASDLISKYVAQNRYYVVNMYILNTGFNIGDKIAYFKYIYDSPWITFNDQIGTQVQIQIGTYNITSDQSEWPWERKVSESGHYVSSVKESVIQPLRLTQAVLADINIVMGRQSKQFERDFGKVDASLGYVGGLFGIVIAFFAFFAASYNEYRYQLMVGEGAFSFDHGQKFKQQDFGIWIYIKYSIYDWLKILCCCCEPNWQKCERIEQTRDEANEQIDIKYFMRRISHLEQVNKLKLTEEQDMLVYLSQPHNLEYVKKKRKVLEYYDAVMEDKPHLTIDNISTIKGVLDYISSPNQTSAFSFNSPQNDQKNASLDQIINQNLQYLQQENLKLQLNDQQFEIEKELAEMFTQLSLPSLQRIKTKIPLFIIYRLKKIYKTDLKGGLIKVEQFKDIIGDFDNL